MMTRTTRTWARAVAVTAVGLAALTGCASGGQDAHAGHGASAPSSAATSSSAPAASSAQGHDHGHMDHPADGGPAPAGIEPAADPTFAVGDTVTLTADHMPGMDGAQATVVGAFRTHTYAVDYTPTTGGAPVKDHQWVVQEELDGVGEERLAEGEKAVMTAEHMPGMKGAEATVASSTDETVYMVDYTADGMAMKNHKWVVESELKAAG